MAINQSARDLIAALDAMYPARDAELHELDSGIGRLKYAQFTGQRELIRDLKQRLNPKTGGR